MPAANLLRVCCQLALFLDLCLVVAGRSFADEHVGAAGEAAPRGEEANQPTLAQPARHRPASSTSEWVFAPIPTYDPSQNLGLQLVSQYIFGSRMPSAGAQSGHPSVLALAAFYTQEDSRGLFAAYMGHLREDTWRLLVSAGDARINYDFYGVGNQLASLDTSIPISQDVMFGMLQITRRTWRSLYVGVRAIGSEVDIHTSATQVGAVSIPPLSDTVHTYGGGLVLQWDTRDNQFFPTTGTFANATAIANGGDVHYGIYSIHWNRYSALADPRTVLALRASLQSSSGDVPFYALPQFGRHSDLRGFKSGKYRDRNLIAVQAEYRRKFGGRWGAVAFAGVGEVQPSLGQLNSDDLLASAGVGLRFRLVKKNPVNLRLDGAYGNDGAAVYLSVGEAF